MVMTIYEIFKKYYKLEKAHNGKHISDSVFTREFGLLFTMSGFKEFREFFEAYNKWLNGKSEQLKLF